MMMLMSLGYHEQLKKTIGDCEPTVAYPFLYSIKGTMLFHKPLRPEDGS